MKLSEYARQNSITYRTAWKYFRSGLIPNAYKLPTGTIIVKENVQIQKPECVVTYARVSSSENKSNLETQSKRLIDYCNARGWKTHLNIQEIGSGLNDNRKKLLVVLQQGKATKIIVEHKDRLARFGVRYISCLCKHINCELIILNQATNSKEDLVHDFVSVVTSFCARLYGQRRNKRRTEKLIQELENENSKKL